LIPEFERMLNTQDPFQPDHRKEILSFLPGESAEHLLRKWTKEDEEGAEVTPRKRWDDLKKLYRKGEVGTPPLPCCLLVFLFLPLSFLLVWFPPLELLLSFYSPLISDKETRRFGFDSADSVCIYLAKARYQRNESYEPFVEVPFLRSPQDWYLSHSRLLLHSLIPLFFIIGKVCIPIDPQRSSEFMIDEVPRLSEIIKEINEYEPMAQDDSKPVKEIQKTSLDHHLQYFKREFLRPLGKSVQLARTQAKLQQQQQTRQITVDI
jgi:hypothetical protein